MQKFAYCAAICPPDTPFNIPLIIALQKSFALVLKLHFHRVLEVIRPRMGCNVISLMSVPVVVSEPVAVVPKPKNSMLPLLVILFLVSYGLMALLVVEQSKTIDSQRALIQQLFSDSTQLSAMKGKAFQEKWAHDHPHAKTQAPAAAAPQAPSTPVMPEAGNKSAAKFRKPVPPKPSQEGQEMADERRSLKTI